MTALAVHPEHRQGDLLLADGARVFTCTKTVQEGARTAMLIVPHLFRLDVRSHADSFDVDVRNIGRASLRSGLRDRRERLGRAFDGTVMKIIEFAIASGAPGVGPITVTLALPSTDRGDAFPCTAMAVQRTAES